MLDLRLLLRFFKSVFNTLSSPDEAAHPHPHCLQLNISAYCQEEPHIVHSVCGELMAREMLFIPLQ